MDEGSYVQVSCSVIKGDEPLRITWHLQGAEVSSEPSLSTTMIGTRSSILIITNVGYRHAGIYNCRAQNLAGAATYSDELRVNGKIGVRGAHKEITITILCHNNHSSLIHFTSSLQNHPK